MKNSIILLLVSALMITGIYSCKKPVKAVTSEKLTVDSFLLTPEAWTGKDVVITGTVSHVCKHSGKKLFLFGKDAEKTVKIKAGGDISTFDVKLEGTEVEVQGKVVEDEKIDETYLKTWEDEIKKSLGDEKKKVCDAENKSMTGQGCDSMKKKEEANDPYAGVKEFRKKLSESGKTFIVIYAIECKTIKEIKK